MQRPAFDPNDLEEERAAFRGTFSHVDVWFLGGDQSGVSGEGSLRRCAVNRLDLSGSTLSDLELMDVCLSEVDLSNAKVRAGIARRVELLRCRAIGLRLTVESASDFYAQDTKLDFAVLEIGRAKGIAVFDSCSFREAVITGDMSNVLFMGCDLTGAEFAASQARGCDLRGSRLRGVRGLLSLRGAKISADQVIDVADALADEAGMIVEG